MDEGHSGTVGGIANGWSDGLLVYDESGVHGSLRDTVEQVNGALYRERGSDTLQRDLC